MTQMIDIKVKDQFSQVYEAQALVRNPSEEDSRALFHRIEHIIIAGEIILPSIELLFESQKSDSIYKLLEA
ncbi:MULTISPECIES: hypothetical protein [Acinetobacter]|jgi:hypothetical protein|uniref:Uncharacterized protein n=1 Tax=Acinetobacter amyesii TaxID=2942470 RepID=A0A1T1H720_9GAMM|nr:MULTISPECIES: hypothetical protein [Acinetobacter]MCL6233603.1 hypothetical protein [Acinetobacter amyesii]MCL6241515.1 hypothetical protein [Acinetobacter amyesii]MCL6248991.1 hypothetical protein [Acinetobacter amyesii]OOV85661.1 hypothetical protein B1202_03220 [Acinetobacter amyesii]UUS56711.1 hypothetical protein MST16_11545 [Acinetobacter sp. YH16040_T]